MTETKTFADVGVDPAICEALDKSGITTPFPIQELTLPLALAGADIIGQARTGTGKTLAFGIPLLQRLTVGKGTQALVIVPTRELCVQVAGDLVGASGAKGVRVAAVYGGKAIDPQVEAIAGGAEIVVGTPGRLLDLMRRRKLDLSTVTGLVLDEADEMLDLGFLPDVEQLVQATAEDRQTLLFSATMPSAVVALARRYMHKPTFLRADVEEIHVAPQTRQVFLSCHRMDKPAVLARILQTPNRGLCLVFTRTKRMADILAEELRERGVPAAAIHSDLRQDARERALGRFRKGRVDVLVATEVAARGLDIAEVTHVVNYDCPDDEKMYLHRIGRTGRAGADGVAVTLAVWNELARLDMIRRTLAIDEPVHEVFSTSDILDELFDLPRRQRRTAPAEPVAAPVAKPVAEPVAEPVVSDSGGISPKVLTTSEKEAAAPPREPRRRTRTRTRPETPRQPKPATRPAAPAPAAAAAPADPPAPPAARRRSRSGNGRPSAAPSRQSRDGGARGQRPDRRARQGAPAYDPEPVAVTVDDARGGGRPRLRRALTITHLP